MFVDSGCERTLLPWKMHATDMGHLEETDVQFRPYGTDIILKCHGAISATVQARSGAKQSTKVDAGCQVTIAGKKITAKSRKKK